MSSESEQGQGWVDVPSNVITQNVLPVFDAIAALGSENALPTKFLPFFMHEFTHHWCFNSSVGTALVLLQQRALLLMRAPNLATSDGVQRLLYDSVLRYLAASQALMPIIEGLAVFSELNAIPGACRSISSPASWGTMLFVRRAESEPTDVEGWKQAWRRVTRNHRTSAEGIERKKLLLLTRLEGPGRGNYLRGYLAIQTLHREAHGKSSLFDDGDFFVTYARHVFFNDHHLAALLLTDRLSGRQWLAKFLKSLNQRIECFSRSDLDAHARELDKLVSSSSDDAVALSSATFVESGSLSRFRKQYDQWMEDPADGLLCDNLLKAWQWQTPLLIRQRRLIRLAVSKGIIRLDESHNVWFCDRRIGPSTSNVPVKEGEGIVALYLLPSSKTLFFLALLDGNVARIGLGRLGELEDEELSLDISAIRYVLAQEEAALIGSPIASLEDIPTWFSGMSEYLAEIERRMDAVWIDLALRAIPSSKRERCRKEMAQVGFGHILRGDYNLIDGLATLSAFSAARLTYSELDAYLAGKANVNDLIDSLQGVEREYEFPLLDLAGGGKPDRSNQVSCRV